MSSEPNPDEIPVEVASENQSETSDLSKSSETSQLDIDELSQLLDIEKQKATEYEDKFKHVLADFQNLEKKTQSDIQNGINSKVDEFMLDFLKIYDDFVRAKEVFSKIEVDTEGLDSILKNMDALLKKYQIVSIDALGEIFDPNLHEAISIISDSNLDDSTITKEIRKGYISHQRVIRPTLVEISKKG